VCFEKSDKDTKQLKVRYACVRVKDIAETRRRGKAYIYTPRGGDATQDRGLR
jgi:hypothetical protein